MVEETAIGGPAREFPATRWTLIAGARAGPEARRAALAELLETYWKPLYYYVRRKGAAVEPAKDAVQGFFAQLLGRDFLDRLDPSRGRFRSFLRASMDHYLANAHEKQSAQRRGGGSPVLSLDVEGAERGMSGLPAAAGEAFDRQWAAQVMERALGRLRREFDDGGRRGPLDAVLDFFRPLPPPTYVEAAARAGLSVAQLKAFLHRVRVRFRELVRDEVAQTVADPTEIEAEMGELVRALKP